ncbi:hypothetical protein [Limnoglobus roseus]|uniref:Uncharacterized protein n=1 Tax=Limnoglobus roseus TaxID=2598579 RepID=A0A5C1A8C6_9BACT|nr:hypothetical protein [Limnoglobus roseus]QEL14443.1 hypothetical protein PX52LOC_01331 [Limnoglobus roseus]
MGSSKTPGSLGTVAGPAINDGTTVRAKSSPPGVIAHSRDEKAEAEAKPVETNVYEIQKTTGTARRLNEAEVRTKCKDPNLAARLQSRKFFILHGGHLTPSSQDTINKINDPSQCERIVGFAVRKIQADAVAAGGKFLDGYYVGFAKAVVEAAISFTPKKPDDGVALAGETFGFEVGDRPSVLPAYQIYDAIARADDENGYDKVQHFMRSMYLQYSSGSDVTDVFQYAKEIRDEVKSWFGGGQGYNGKDMLANNRGQAYGQQLYAKYHPIRNFLRNLD